MQLTIRVASVIALPFGCQEFHDSFFCMRRLAMLDFLERPCNLRSFVIPNRRISLFFKYLPQASPGSQCIGVSSLMLPKVQSSNIENVLYDNNLLTMDTSRWV